MAEDATYFSKDDTVCPICGTAFKREELRMGGGRLSAGDLTEELRRLYQPTQKYGKIIPLLYTVTICPNCLYAADDYDFTSLPQKAYDNVNAYREVRSQYLLKVFGKIPDFTQKRDMISGVASYMMAISSYPFFEKRKFAPSVKMAMYSLRLAWLFNDMFEEAREPGYRELSEIFYKKAADYYELALNNQTKGIEPLDGAKTLGPDTDKNFGYDGVVYLNGILKFRQAHLLEDPVQKLKVYEEVRIILSKVFGFGRKAKEKPGPLLETARGIYDRVTEEIESLQASLGDAAPAFEQENGEQ